MLNKTQTANLRERGVVSVPLVTASELVQAADALGVPLRDVLVYAESDRVVIRKRDASE